MFCDDLEGWDREQGVGGRSQREEIYVNIWWFTLLYRRK